MSLYGSYYLYRTTSKINGVVYYPWSDLDLSELRTVSALPMDFCDPDGLIKLSEKQKSRLAGWMRPGEICENPKMAHLISSFSIKQVYYISYHIIIISYHIL